jgi:hypothetical protein
MLTVAPEHLDTALGRLASSERALLELSLRREVADAALAELLRVDIGELRRRREVSLSRLAQELGVESDEHFEAVLVERWREGVPQGAPDEAAPEGPEAAGQAGPEEARVTEAPVAAATVEGKERAPRRRWAAAIVCLTLLAAAGIVAAVLASGDDEEPAAQASAARLQPLPGASGDASGRARITGEGERRSLVLRLEGLPRLKGSYQAWLYDSVTDAVPVARFPAGSPTVEKRLPADPGRFRFLDVSREPADGNPNHSGASVLRVPLDRLLTQD